MLPEFPVVKAQLNPLLMNILATRVRQHMGFFGEIPVVPIPEGSGTHLVRADGSMDDTPMEKMQSEISFELRPGEPPCPDAVMQSIDRLARDIARQQVQVVHKRLDQVTRETGNVVDAHTEPLSSRLLNDALERMEIPFTDEGEALLPSIIVHPDVGKDLMARKDELKGDVVEGQRHDAIIARKREEFFARESRRKLVS